MDDGPLLPWRALSVLCPSRWQAARAFGVCLALAACGSAVALAAAVPPTVRTTRGCYLVGAPIQLRGSGFAADRTHVTSIDGVYFGQDRANAHGALNRRDSLRPGPAGPVQRISVQIS